MPASESQANVYEAILQSVGGDLAAVDALLDQRLHQAGEPLIAELAQHLIQAGGKRLRPLLTLAVARSCGYQNHRHIQLAAAVELIHSATLLHDDVVDESALRRGRAGANTLWGNKATVLVGDFLFSCSFQLMVETGSLPVLSTLADAAAVIAEGEVMQLSTAQALDTDDARYLVMVESKTAALFKAAAEAGAQIADADEATVRAYATYGSALGVAFQLADDALDYEGQAAELGKHVGDDFNEGKATLPTLLAYRRGTDEARAFWQRTITRGERNPGDLETALEYVSATGAAADTFAKAEDYANRARGALAEVPASTIRDHLDALASFAARRRS